MFEGKKYITMGVKEKIPLLMQKRMWDMIKLAGFQTKLDYLQVFELKRYKQLQLIIHRQEKPEFKRKYLMDTDNIVIEKIFVIDDGDYCTMLLSSEY